MSVAALELKPDVGRVPLCSRTREPGYPTALGSLEAISPQEVESSHDRLSLRLQERFVVFHPQAMTQGASTDSYLTMLPTAESLATVSHR